VFSAGKEKIFERATASCLIFFVVFILALVIALASYTNPATIWRALSSPEIIFALKLSLFTSTIAVLLCMILAVPAAYVLSRSDFPGKTVVDTILDIPLTVPPIVLGFSLLVFFSTPLGRAIQNLGITFVFERPGIILAQFIVISPLALRLMKSAFDNIGSRYEKVARTLGCNQRQTFFWIVLPLARNSLLAAAVLTWARAMGEFGATLILAGATKMKTEVMSIAIWLNIKAADLPKAIAAVLILISVSTLALLLIKKIGQGVRYD